MNPDNAECGVRSADLMRWYCIACHFGFDGPKTHTPENGCPRCGSHQIFDCNIEIPIEELGKIGLPPAHSKCRIINPRKLAKFLERLQKSAVPQDCAKWNEIMEKIFPGAREERNDWRRN